MFVAGNKEPQLLHIGILDQTTAITVSHAILTALLDRERRGVGQEVHISLYATALWMQYINLLITGVLSKDPCIPGNRTQHSPLRNRFRCKDGKWIFGTHHPEEKYWATFCMATEQTALLEDPRYTTDSVGPTNYVELNKIFDQVFATKTADEWMEIFLPHGLMFCSVQTIEDVKTDPQALVNDFVVPFEHPLQGKVQIPGYPIKFSGCSAGTKSAAPQLGEHTDDILQGLGYSARDLEELKKEGVVR
jgi:crotonobetainyl-CoA:carnitine CoA-transferase CaiB-like acyl-CoA transferase